MNPWMRDLLCLEDDGLHAPGLCSFGGSGGGTTTATQNTVTQPWSGQEAYLSDIYGNALSNFQNNTPQYYPGNTYAGLNSNQQNSIQNAIDLGNTRGNTALNSSNNTLTSMLNPGYTGQQQNTFNSADQALNGELSSNYLNPWNSPSFNTVVGNTLASAVPAATSSFTSGNRTGGGLHDRAVTMAATDAVGNLAQNQYQANQAIQNQAIQQAATNLQNRQTNQINAATVAPTVDAQQSADITSGSQAGAAQQSDAQNQINALISAWNYNQTLPWDQLTRFSNAVNSTGSTGNSTNTTSATPYYDNTFSQVATGVTSAATLAAAAAAII